jgi:hypothetical protein
MKKSMVKGHPSRRKPKRKPAKMSVRAFASKIIGFRLPHEYDNRLREHAEYYGVSPSDVARQIVIDAMMDL